MKRFPLPDLLKGFAVFLIVPVHILELFINFYGRETLLGQTLLFLGGPIAVPVFMIVMGYFIAKNNKNLTQNFLRGVKVFILGFFLNIGINIHLLLKIKFAEWQIDPMEYIFGVDILYLAGLSIMVLSIIKQFSKGQKFIALGFALIVLGLTGWMNEKMIPIEPNFLTPFIAGDYTWSYFPLFPWLAYPLIGFAFFHFEKTVVAFLICNRLRLGVLLTSIVILVVIFSKSAFQITTDLSSYYHHTFWYSLWALGVVVLWTLLWRSLLNKFAQSRIGIFFQWLGKNITIFYIIQWLIIGNIATAIYQTQSLKTFPIWFIAIFSITALLTWLIEKSKIKPA